MPTTKMIRQFLFYMADSGNGHARNSKITRRTIEGHAGALFGALRQCNRPLERDVRHQIMVWARYDLTAELELNKDLGISTPIAHASDVSIILREMYSPLGIRQVRSMRILLNLSIFVNLMIDGCARIHELVSTERYPEHYLRWKDVQFWVFRSRDTSDIRISGLVKLKYLKGLKDSPDKWKEIPLMLLSPSRWMEHSLRLIIYAALIDGHIIGASNWAEFEELMCQCDSESGKLIPMDESCGDLPVIPAINHTKAQVTIQSPPSPDTIPRHLQRLGKLCGFKNILKRCVSHVHFSGSTVQRFILS